MNQALWEKKTLGEIDGHYCMDWDGLPVSAWTNEYTCCCCSGKSRLGRVIGWFVLQRFNLSYWWLVGRHLKSL